MAPTIQDIRARLKAAEDKNKGGGNSYTSDNASFPFWNIPANSTATLRFLPDGDVENPYFWVERSVIRLPFAGVKGQNNSKPVTVQVPCMHMYGESCPITEEIKPWWKDPELENVARTYYKKRSFLYQGLVVNSPLKEETLPENLVRRFVMNAELHNKVKAALMDEERDNLPTDFDQGYDFKITKTQGPKFASYDTSNWSIKTRSLSDEERAIIERNTLLSDEDREKASIEANGLFNLAKFLPKKPDAEHLAIIMQMFEASIDGQLYDPELFGKFYKPFGAGGDDTKSASKPVAEAVSKSVVQEEEVDAADEEVVVAAEPVTKPAGASNAATLLAELKRRQSNK